MNEIEGPQFKRRSIGAKGAGETLTVTIAAPGKFRFPTWLDKLITDDDDRTLKEVLDHPRHVGILLTVSHTGRTMRAWPHWLHFVRSMGCALV